MPQTDSLDSQDTYDSLTEPLALHRHQEEGRLGGLVYAQSFVRYLESGVRTQRAIDDGYGDWWRNAYLTKRLKAQMLQLPQGGRAYLAILAIDRDDMPLETAAARCERSPEWLRRMVVRFDGLRREYARRDGARRHRRHIPLAC